MRTSPVEVRDLSGLEIRRIRGLARRSCHKIKTICDHRRLGSSLRGKDEQCSSRAGRSHFSRVSLSLVTGQLVNSAEKQIEVVPSKEKGRGEGQ